VRAGSKLVRYVSLVRQVWLEDVVTEKVVGWVEHVSDGRDVVAAVPELFDASQQRIKTLAVGSWTHSRPCWRRILEPRDNCGAEYVV